MRMDYDEIQDQVRKTGPYVDDFLAMHRNNDPYDVARRRVKRKESGLLTIGIGSVLLKASTSAVCIMRL